MTGALMTKSPMWIRNSAAKDFRGEKRNSGAESILILVWKIPLLEEEIQPGPASRFIIFRGAVIVSTTDSTGQYVLPVINTKYLV